MSSTGTTSRPIFHLTRRDGSPLFLHPFIKRGSTLQPNGSIDLEGHYGEEPRVESLTILRNELYRRIDEDVRDWINEKRFIPRFLLSSLAFLLAFFFMALVIHTPIPLVDELLGAGAVGVLVFVLLGRRFDNSRSASERRLALRARVDAAVFSEEEYVRSLEAILRRMEGQENIFLQPTRTEEAAELWRRDRERTAQVVGYIRQLLTTKPYRVLLKELRRGSLSSRTENSIESGQVIPALVLLLRELNASAE